MHEAAGAPPQLTDGACAAAQSTGAAALRRILQARPLALRVHRERAIVDKTTDLCVGDLHGGRARRKDNRRPRILARVRPHRANCRPGGGRPSSHQERQPLGLAQKGGCFSVRPVYVFAREGVRCVLVVIVRHVALVKCPQEAVAATCRWRRRRRQRTCAPVLRLELEPALLLLRLQIWEGAQSDAVAGRVLGTIRTWLCGAGHHVNQ